MYIYIYICIYIYIYIYIYSNHHLMRSSSLLSFPFETSQACPRQGKSPLSHANYMLAFSKRGFSRYGVLYFYGWIFFPVMFFLSCVFYGVLYSFPSCFFELFGGALREERRAARSERPAALGAEGLRVKSAASRRGQDMWIFTEGPRIPYMLQYILCFECAHFATFCHALPWTLTMGGIAALLRWPCLSNCGTSATTPSVRTPSGSCQISIWGFV